MKAPKARQIATFVLSESLGGTLGVTVSDSGFEVRPNLLREYEERGHSGVMHEITIEGWGAAFERRRLKKRLLLDHTLATDALVASILDQAGTALAYQNRQRARAAAHGITAPLSREQFVDPTRLSMDASTARILLDACGSENATWDWLRAQLASVWRNDPHNRRALFIHGFEAIVPIDLKKGEPTTGLSPSPFQPIWLGNEVRYMASDMGAGQLTLDRWQHALTDTPISLRAVLGVSRWPTPTVQQAIERDNDRRRCLAIPHQKPEYRLQLDSVPISVNEAFG